MNMNDAMIQAGRECGGNDVRSQCELAGAALIADAINRLAKAQERQADIQEKQWQLTSGMMEKMGPMVDKTTEIMDNAINEQNEGEKWKRRGSLGQGDDNEEDNGS